MAESNTFTDDWEGWREAKGEKKRIIANDLPSRTLSISSFDNPKRKDVIQVDLPYSTRKVIEYEKDPNNLMRPVTNNYGNSLKLKPGLTGWAQVNSYDGMPVSQKAAFDGEYAYKISFLFDLLIFFKTFFYLMKKPPVY